MAGERETRAEKSSKDKIKKGIPMKSPIRSQVWIPVGYHTVTPTLMVEGCDRLVRFLKQTFDAEELSHMNWQDGTIAHAEIRIGDSRLMLGEAKGPTKPMPCALYVYLDDVDAAYQRALKAGAESVHAPADMFWGDRHGGVKDPCGNIWWIATHIEDVPPAEMARRGEAWMKEQQHLK